MVLPQSQIWKRSLHRIGRQLSSTNNAGVTLPILSLRQSISPRNPLLRASDARLLHSVAFGTNCTRTVLEPLIFCSVNDGSPLLDHRHCGVALNNVRRGIQLRNNGHMPKAASFATYRGRRGFVHDGDEEDELVDVVDMATEVDGYFSKLYGRGGVVSEEDSKGSKGNANGTTENDDDDLYMGQEGYHLGMTPERKERWLKKRDLLAQNGRLWTDPMYITDEDWATNVFLDDLPDWTPDVVSNAALDRVTVLDKVLTLEQLARLPLPPPPPVLPAEHPKQYASYRKAAERARISLKVRELVADRVDHIMKLDNSGVKQDAIDELFELVEEEVRDAEGVLKIHRTGSHPYSAIPDAKFEVMIEDSLSDYLKEVNEKPQPVTDAQGTDHAMGTGSEENTALVVDQTARPVYMDILKSSLGQDRLFAVTGVSGGIKDEWEMSAHSDTKRILLRQCIREIAEKIMKAEKKSEATKIFVEGRRGVGKSAALTATVAAVRESGSIVLFVKDGERLREFGFYIEPCSIKTGMYNLPMLAKEMCLQLLEAHGTQLDDLNLPISEEALSFLEKSMHDADTIATAPSLTEMLRLGSEDAEVSSGCYSAVISTLMNQTEIPFVVVLDEYNCYFDTGRYFHEDYDKEVEKPIPMHLISLFQPLLAMGGYEDTPSASLMKRGAFVAGITYSRPVAAKRTKALIARVAEEEDVHVVEVPRFSAMEIEHVIANYEATGMGSLRFNKGKTITNAQEVAFYGMVSGGVGYRLLDACLTIA